MIEKKLHHCEEDDPNRCQAVGKSGQCPYLSVEDEKYCQRHGGNRNAMLKEKKRANQYRLQIWQQRLEEFSQSDEVKSLRDEIGILRLLMETILNRCEDHSTLMLQSSRISDLAVKIEKLVTSCNRLETNMGMLLDKSAALNLAGQIVEIIGHHVEDANTIEAISNGIIDILATLSS